MSEILFYSNFCNHCKTILQHLSRSKVKEGVHFICIDKRIKKGNDTYVILENQEIFLPPNVRSVPSLFLLNRGNAVVEGDDVLNYIIDRTEQVNNVETGNNGEPAPFGLNEFGSIVSDNFSFLEQTPDELMAKGNGGMRQTHNYACLNDNQPSIETPFDDYKSDTINNEGVSLDTITSRRNNEIPPQKRNVF
tara:strand:+ start:4212 stop:4787 length:576 start_codon:yes stop_codon:yes gene_type:complete